MHEVSIRFGLPHGPCRFLYIDREIETNFFMGLQHGVCREYENGDLVRELNYYLGAVFGPIKEYRPDGTIRQMCVPHQFNIGLRKNGQIKSQWIDNQNLPGGSNAQIFKTFYRNGKIQTITYTTSHDVLGYLLHKKDTPARIKYNEDGEIISGEWAINGLLHCSTGPAIINSDEWWLNGVKLERETFVMLTCSDILSILFSTLPQPIAEEIFDNF